MTKHLLSRSDFRNRIIILFTILSSNFHVNSQCWRTVKAGEEFSVGIKTDGTLWAWGTNEFGILGNSSMTFSAEPVQVGFDSDWKTITIGGGTGYALKENGTLWVWGANNYGQLGMTTTNWFIDSLIKVNDDQDWELIDAGQLHVLAKKVDGSIYSWGYNQFAQLGDGTHTNKYTPTLISQNVNWDIISGGGVFSVAIKSDGTLWAWGGNQTGQLGDGSSSNEQIQPIQTQPSSNWVMINSGKLFSLGLKTDGTLWFWGDNGYGSAGNGTINDVFSPNQIGLSSQWIFCNASIHGSSFGIKTDGTLWGWGQNDSYQLGIANNTNQLSPILINSTLNWKEIHSGLNHTVALTTDGSLYSWGENSLGQLGNAMISNYETEPISIECPQLLINEFSLNEKNKIFPNPVHDELNIDNLDTLNLNSVRIVNGLGVVYHLSNKLPTNEQILNLPNGYYLIEIENENSLVRLNFIKI